MFSGSKVWGAFGSKRKFQTNIYWPLFAQIRRGRQNSEEEMFGWNPIQVRMLITHGPFKPKDTNESMPREDFKAVKRFLVPPPTQQSVLKTETHEAHTWCWPTQEKAPQREVSPYNPDSPQPPRGDRALARDAPVVPGSLVFQPHKPSWA